MDYLISYDIHNDRRRNKVSKVLLDYGRRVQYSVFEIARLSPGDLERCVNRILPLLDLDRGDSLRVYSFCRDCSGRIVVYGRGRPMVGDDALTVV